MRVVIQKLNHVNKNGRAYTRESFINLPVSCFGQVGMPKPKDVETLHIESISHHVENIRFEDDELVGNIEFLNTPSGRFLKDLSTEVSIVYRLAGIGRIENKHVTDFTLCSVNAIAEELSS